MAIMPSQSHNSQPLPVIILLLLLLVSSRLFPEAAAVEQDEQQPITLPGCLDRCGDTRIPFPFGMEPGCFRKGFQVTCNDSFDPHRAFLAYPGVNKHITEVNLRLGQDPQWSIEHDNTSLQLMDISIARGEARAYGLVSSLCNMANLSTEYIVKRQKVVLGEKSPFLLSLTRNLLIGVGWSVEPQLTSLRWTWAGRNFSRYDIGFSLTCLSDLSFQQLPTNGSCCGLGCCKGSLLGSGPLTDFSMGFTNVPNKRWPTNPCSYGMVVEKGWYSFSCTDLYGVEVLPGRYPDGVPFVLDFSIRNTSCPAKGQKPPPDYACISANSYCTNSTSAGIVWGYVCKCLDHYDGNPYIADGCQDIDECKLRKLNPELYPCSSDGICKNKLGGYVCPCKHGMKGDGIKGTCTHKFPLAAQVTVGGIGGIFLIAVISFLILLRQEKRKTREFYEKNGGPTLEKAKIIKLFKKEALKPILKSSNFIGKGGFGEVYKGLVDNEQVAVKKPINGTVLENNQFANEVIIQSQVIHKNIVRLIGCCLEVDIPMLVYEYLCNGSLDDILHDNDKVSLVLDVRLSIAIEAADALAYMHSKTNTKILHGDVKPANILLDDKCVPKISDFGMSRLIPIDKRHTTSVIGDMSYMDPVYLQTGLLTEKSDVYSFGVVILELISRKKARHFDGSSLVNNFIESHKEQKKLTHLFDKEIAVAEDLEILEILAGIALECLNLDVDQRPSMTEVAERLLIVNRSRKL